MAEAFCASCGGALKEGKPFCPSCGARVNEEGTDAWSERTQESSVRTVATSTRKRGAWFLLAVVVLAGAGLMLVARGWVPIEGTGDAPKSTEGALTSTEDAPKSTEDLSLGDKAIFSDGYQVHLRRVEAKDWGSRPDVRLTVSLYNGSDQQVDFDEYNWGVQEASGRITYDLSPYQMAETFPLGRGKLAPGGRTSGTILLHGSGVVKVLYDGGEDYRASWSLPE